jgi:hypothetical protein
MAMSVIQADVMETDPGKEVVSFVTRVVLCECRVQLVVENQPALLRREEDVDETSRSRPDVGHSGTGDLAFVQQRAEDVPEERSRAVVAAFVMLYPLLPEVLDRPLLERLVGHER